MKRRLWSKDELILAFNLYLKLPFGKMHRSNPDIIKLANLLGRTPSSIAMRLVNFASIDPYHQERGVSGLPGGVKQCQPIWDEFNNNREELIFESEKILAEYENQTIESKYSFLLQDLKVKGEDKVREVKTRVNQNVFRQIILNVYATKCAISGIDIPVLLNASHIIPWSRNEKERLNPSNGICLSKLYDAAFDNGLIGIKPNFSIILSSKITAHKKEAYFEKHFGFLEHNKLHLPERFQPKKEFLEYHLDTIFQP
jgi:putative restriction endonuclease